MKPQFPAAVVEGRGADAPAADDRQMSQPFRKLFEAPAPTHEAPKTWQDPVVTEVEPSSTVVCGMTVIQADPRVDPKIAIPADTSRHHHIRAIPPPACGS